MAAAASTAATDEQLVAAIRSGSDDALETLFLRYRDRIGAYVRGMVPDHGKAEDIVQETFISALRNLRSSDRSIAFRPWIYQIARNACIDQLRRQKRAQEVSLDSDDFHPQDEGRISQAGPSTHGAVSQREDMHALRQAFGGLPASQHEVLVLRELEGLSYTEIASRMNLSAAAVESMLFRARRGLKYEYDEIATGERCRRMQPLMAAVSEGVGGARDRKALARHIRFCTGCRRDATAMGLGTFVTDALAGGRMKRAARRAAALFPIPPFLRRRGGTDGADPSVVERFSARVQAPFAQLGVAGGPAAENAASAVPKAIAIVAAAAVIGGGGFAGQSSTGASASAALGSAAGLSGPGLPGQPPGSSAGGQIASSPLGPSGGLVQPSQTAASGQGAPAARGGLTGLGGLPVVGGTSPAGPAGPSGPLDTLLGGAGNLLGSGAPASGNYSPGGLGDVIGKAVPKSIGGITLPQLSGGGGPSGGGSGSGGGSPVDKIVPKLPVNPPSVTKPKLPSVPSTPSAPKLPVNPPALPSVPVTPQVQTPPLTPPALQSVPTPNLQVPSPAPQLPPLG